MPATSTHTVREHRTLALLHTAAAWVASPELARDWLHTPRQELGELTPAAAAWVSEPLATMARRLLLESPPQERGEQ